MTAALLMDLADCGSPEKILDVVFRHHPAWTAPVPVEDLARTVSIDEFKELEGDSFEGALVTDPRKTRGVIFYKAGAPMERRRFTIAHELGHFLIPSHKGNRQCTAADLREARRDNDHRRQEAEANRFAAGLLMPKLWFLRDMSRLGDADVTHVQTLAKQYCTSLEATSNRYTELTTDLCAFVFSKDGVIRYARPTPSFPRLSVKKGDTLPEDCASLVAPAQPLRVTTSWIEVDGSVWLQTGRGQKPPKILEQTMRQTGGFQVTLLFINSDEIDEDDEESELEDSWGVKFPQR